MIDSACNYCRHPINRHRERSGCTERIPTRSGESIPCYCLVKAVKPCEAPDCCEEAHGE